ncbi:MAG: alpha/beta fold hydrolase [Erysipelotrichaceae bacterium]|nr:alpha/beta fold hydrolase [Erysipelotrichaceae bacterium]
MILKRKLLPLAALGMAAGLVPDAMVRIMLGKNETGQQVRDKTMAGLDKRKKNPDDIMYRAGVYLASKQEENERFEKECPEEKVTVLSFDGLRLAGFMRKNKEGHRWLLAFHGYRATHSEITRLQFAREFYNMGFHVLAPDHRMCGESEGERIGMGWLERFDVLTWIQYVIAEDPKAQIVLFGESMGAAAVLAACGLFLPPHVKAVIADSSFSSVSAISGEVAARRYHLPSGPAVALCDSAARRYAGFKLSEADIAAELAKAKIPVLLMHGKEDSIVPFENFRVLSEVNTNSELKAVSFEGADHVCSSLVEPQLYWQTVRDFLDGRFS